MCAQKDVHLFMRDLRAEPTCPSRFAVRESTDVEGTALTAEEVEKLGAGQPPNPHPPLPPPRPIRAMAVGRLELTSKSSALRV